MKKADLSYRDTWRRTVKKAPWKRLSTEAALGLVSLGTSIAVSPIPNLAAAIANRSSNPAAIGIYGQQVYKCI